MSGPRSKLQVLFFPNIHQIGMIQTRVRELTGLSDQELVDRYNAKAEIGMFGNQTETREVVSLGLALKERFGDPVVHLHEHLVYCPCTVALQDDGSLKKHEFTDWE